MAEVLLHYGKDLSQSRLGLIRSPFRDERTPSFHILSNGYAWKDFGDGSGGGVIDLVMRLENCGRETAIGRLREMRTGGAVFTADLNDLRCPECRGAKLTPLTGRELTLKEILLPD